jgi:dTDP-glucose pyrophosphorylase
VLSFLLFPVERPELFDAVVTDAGGRVLRIHVKNREGGTNWVWGAFKAPGSTLIRLHELWRARGRRDDCIGTLVNAYLAAGGAARGIRAGQAYVDVGKPHGYREAIRLLGSRPPAEAARVSHDAGSAPGEPRDPASVGPHVLSGEAK